MNLLGGFLNNVNPTKCIKTLKSRVIFLNGGSCCQSDTKLFDPIGWNKNP
jgi:hypothetical protein